MPYDVPQLLKMSQPELDALFTSNAAGPIPDGQADGTAIVAPGTVFSPEIARFVGVFAWQGKVLDAKAALLRNRIGPFGLNAIIAKVYKDASWLDGKEWSCSTTPTRRWLRTGSATRSADPGAGAVPWAIVLGQDAAD